MGVVRDSSSKRVSGRSTPARPAIAIRWMIALVEPPMAMPVRTALSKASRVRTFDGFRSSRTISMMRRPDISASAMRRESAAGIAALPGRVMPSVSAIEAMVDAVPITMQCPAERERQDSISQNSSSLRRPARRSAQKRQLSVPEPMSSVRQRLRHLPQVGVAVGQLGPGVGDADHRAAVEHQLAETLRLDPRAVGEAVQVLLAEPVVAAQRGRGHGRPPSGVCRAFGAGLSGLLMDVITRLYSTTTSWSSNAMVRTLLVVSMVRSDGRRSLRE